MTESTDKQLPFGALILEYDEACNALIEADKAEYDARCAATSCRNRVNDLQKKIAARCDAMEKNAPRGTDWASARLSRERAA